MIMHKGYIAIAVYIVHVGSVFSSLAECNYFCDADECRTSRSNNVSILDSIEYCEDEDIPNDVDIIPTDYQDGTNFLGDAQISLIPPKRFCKYIVTLYANESVYENACMHHEFKNRKNEIHTRSVAIPFQYVFTACYGVEIYYNGGSYKFVGNNRLVTTNYNRTEVVLPPLKCVYNVVPNNTKEHKELNFEIDFSSSIIEEATFQLKTTYIYQNVTNCQFQGPDLLKKNWSFEILNEYIQNKRNNSNISLVINGVYERKINFMIEAVGNTSYCVLMTLWDTRCARHPSLWKTRRFGNDVCHWFRECQNISAVYHTDANSNAKFYEAIVITMLSMLSMLGILYCICRLYTCNIQEIKLYISPSKRNVKTDQRKYNKMFMRALKETENLFCDNISNTRTDIVLLYPKSSESFMSLMADFRGILGTVCQCPIHDWYDGMQWNHVAEIGGSDWFSQMLSRGARVIWVDTLTTRSLIKRRFQKDFFVESSEQHDYVEIGDFRDIVFPIIFTLAKRNVDASMIQRRKHFIMRLKGFEDFENEDDPFVDLSSHKRYLIPLDLSSLCSDLSIVNFDGIPSITRRKEDLI